MAVYKGGILGGCKLHEFFPLLPQHRVTKIENQLTTGVRWTPDIIFPPLQSLVLTWSYFHIPSVTLVSHSLVSWHAINCLS